VLRLPRRYPPYHYTESRVTVEFLPEPVTFKDGDVILFEDRIVYVRRGGRWDEIPFATKQRVLERIVGDEEWASALAEGIAVRLVPEGNDG
jgi:hypothetical protein